MSGDRKLARKLAAQVKATHGTPSRFEPTARAYANRWNRFQHRPRIHPLVPHPGSGEGAVRALVRQMEKEAVLAQQAKARELVAQ